MDDSLAHSTVTVISPLTVTFRLRNIDQLVMETFQAAMVSLAFLADKGKEMEGLRKPLAVPKAESP